MPTTTLDAERTDLLRDFLTLEAAADVAAAHTVSLIPARHPARRAAVAAGAAILVGGALFVGDVVVGGSGPAVVDSAEAVAFVTDGGWTTIRLQDRDAEPQAVLDELLAAGFDARIQRMELATTTDASGRTTTVIQGLIDGDQPDSRAFVSIAAGAEDLLGLSVALPPGEVSNVPPSTGDAEPGLSTSTEGEDGPTTEASGVDGSSAVIDDWNEAHGFRFEDDGSVVLHNGADLTVLVLVAEDLPAGS